MNLRSIYYAISPKSRFLVRKLYYLPIDFFSFISRSKNKLVPNKGDIFIGGGDFATQGKHLFDLLKKYASIEPDHAVLDIGCGIGRVAVPLTGYLSNSGKYEGFDVVKKGIIWCENHITKDFPNFRFQYIPLNNDLYHLTDKKAENFKFPYEDNSFNTIFLFSVFTHMQPHEVQNYLKEINRVLKPDGKCLSTFFLYDDQIESEISNKNRSFSFPFEKGNYRVMNEKVPSANIAFNEDYLNQMIEKSQLKSENKIYGRWANRADKDLYDFQDILVLRKAE
ncbi:class I SAM-dependent methyltransferase [Flavobacterium aquidurense]|uniref:Methyltransferase domain protein n=1 Tax=Flavobacterium aquidurense TaxID=362413 RepID=A0A0Q0RYY5_9FLAO|nr:class I SAM-dependent methyltransferase [Flavobacterium aquidurense]KQB37706.1 Methyltransferase domain protein [Flavobacterium aquidurense]